MANPFLTSSSRQPLSIRSVGRRELGVTFSQKQPLVTLDRISVCHTRNIVCDNASRCLGETIIWTTLPIGSLICCPYLERQSLGSFHVLFEERFDDSITYRV